MSQTPPPRRRRIRRVDLESAAQQRRAAQDEDLQGWMYVLARLRDIGPSRARLYVESEDRCRFIRREFARFRKGGVIGWAPPIYADPRVPSDGIVVLDKTQDTIDDALARIAAAAIVRAAE